MRQYARFALLIAVFFSAVLVSLAHGHARAGDRARGIFDFERVGNLAGAAAPAPAPNDTLAITAAIPYLGQYGTGEAYVYLADAHSTLTNPVVVVEGFDINNDMNWDELYELLNQEGLLETLREIGFDAVVLNFTESTDYLQRNAFVVVELLQQVQAAIAPDMDFVLTGASMGGLISRYALAYMETSGPAHRVRTFISFDAPHRGANITLGVQYWLDFFSGLSDAAAQNLERLDTPAARQMLVYHHTDPPGTTGESDPLRADFLADLTAVGEWPSQPRLVAVANGSGYGDDQGYTAGTQVIDYEYSAILTDITGNVWAVPDGNNQMIFDGNILVILPFGTMQVTVSATKPYDSAPGGFRNTLADMDSTEAPYGDIVALYPNHCFVPTVSALAIDTQDLFYDIAGATASQSNTPFDVAYYPAENQEHGTITAESKGWFLSEVKWASTDVPTVKPGDAGVVLHQNVPNPFNPSTSIGFTLRDAGDVTLAVFDAAGRRVVTLLDGPAEAGTSRIEWNGVDGKGERVSSGVYFYRLSAGGRMFTRKLVMLK
jgi:hypothetical protein